MISNKYFYLGNNGIGLEGINWLQLNEWKMLKWISAHPLPNISIMPLIAYTWNSKKDIHFYTKNKYMINEM
jgi:hypothetical protein